jgi:hypothetical protein
MIWAAVQLALIFFVVPETYHPVLLRNKARKLRTETGEERWIAPIERLDRSILMTVVWSCVRPFQLLVLEPMVSHDLFFLYCVQCVYGGPVKR